ncbi:uncharacterized protein LOC120630110 [Pararge aegeria]|uniref:Jg21240 protein n=1 Tax=Pararge aegeria aegeria TaxID=348720 RepID=A0A8S4QL47_9NEOP|nr:uncharacterized protein LOC120630110 [Pararge aegeria]CAH2211528.1 jg21240 [Pararge aegeria aegeria]
MNRLFDIFICVMAFKSAVSISEVNQACINSYQDSLDNNFLIGTWFKVCEFAQRLNLPSSNYCEETVIKRATETDIQRYREGYKQENPFNFDGNPVISESFIFKGMLMGNTEAKYFVFDPENYFYKEDKYIAKVFRRVSDNYLLVHQCQWRGYFKSLLSRKRNVTKAELNRVIATMNKDVGGMETQRFCTNDTFF